MTSLEAALKGEWLTWAGLPPGLTEAALIEALGPGVVADEREPARLAGQLVESRRFRRPSPPAVVRVWFEGTGQNVLLVELEEPASLDSPEALLTAWGPADRVAPGRRPVFGALTTEHVFLARGAALTIAESYDDPPAFPPRLALAQLFVPTDLQGFIVRLGGNDRFGPAPLLGPRR